MCRLKPCSYFLYMFPKNFLKQMSLKVIETDLKKRAFSSEIDVLFFIALKQSLKAIGN